jgi:hypothetical protein
MEAITRPGSTRQARHKTGSRTIAILLIMVWRSRLWPRFMVNESEWPDSSSDQSSGNSNGAQELCADGDSSPVTAGTAGEDALMNPEEKPLVRKPKKGVRHHGHHGQHRFRR